VTSCCEVFIIRNGSQLALVIIKEFIDILREVRIIYFAGAIAPNE